MKGFRVSDIGDTVFTKIFETLKLSSEYPNLKILAKGHGVASFTDTFDSYSESLAQFDLDTEPLVFIQSEIYDPTDGTSYDMIQIPYINRNASASIYAHYNVSISTAEVSVSMETSGGDSSLHELEFNYLIMYEGN